MANKYQRPKTKDELEDREIRGFWRAIALANKVGESRERITLSTLLSIHKTIFEFAAPEMAGRFRKDGEDIKKLNCIEPPLGKVVEEQIYLFWKELDEKLAVIPLHPKQQTNTQVRKWREKIFEVATWAQHKIAAIHPFCDGNGRMARLITNIILRRYKLPPSQVKYEKKEDKEEYLKALCQIDLHQDYEPLRALIIRGVYDAYLKEKKIRSRKG